MITMNALRSTSRFVFKTRQFPLKATTRRCINSSALIVTNDSTTTTNSTTNNNTNNNTNTNSLGKRPPLIEA